MIEARRLKNVVIFVQTILSFVLSRKVELESSISSLYTKDMNRVELDVGNIMVVKCQG